MAAERGRRARHKDRTRLAIQTAAIELYEERGYDSTNVEDIADRAGVAQRTFFRYFPSKELTLFSDDSSQQVADLVAEAPPELSPVAALQWVMHRVLSIESTPLDRRRQAIRRELSARPAVERQMAHLDQYMRARIRSAFVERLGSDPDDATDIRPDVLVALYVGVGRAMRQDEQPRDIIVDQWFQAVRDLSVLHASPVPGRRTTPGSRERHAEPDR